MKSLLTPAFLTLLITGVLPPADANEPPWFSEIKAAPAAKVKSPKDQPPQPPVEARRPSAEYNYGEWKFPWSGVSIVWDAVNGEALFLCGHHGGAPFGEIGSWSLTNDGRTWNRLEWASPLLDPLRTLALAARKPAKEGEAAARRIYYAALETPQEAAAVKEKPAQLVNESSCCFRSTSRQPAAGSRKRSIEPGR
jgi:hypothetical protein